MKLSVWKWLDGAWVEMGRAPCQEAADSLADALGGATAITRLGERPCEPN